VEEMMDRLLQDAVDTEPGGLHHAMFSAVAAELDRATTRFVRQDPRPWRADVRRVGSVESAEAGAGLQEVPFWEMVYGTPSEVVPKPARSYDYKTGSYGLVGSDGSVLAPTDVDRAVETRGGLYVQAGDRLFQFDEETGAPEQVQISQTPAAGADRWTLVSASETDRRMLVGRPEQKKEVAAQVDGTDIVVHGTGTYEIELNVTGVTSTEEGVLQEPPGYERPARLYNADGDRVSYSFIPSNVPTENIEAFYPTVALGDGTGDENILSIGSVIEESAIEGAGSGYTLFYHAKHEYTHRTSPSEAPTGRLREGRVSFADELEHFDRMPSAGDVTARQVTDRLCQVPAGGEPVWVDSQGFVGDVATGHPIEHVLLARHQVAVSGDGYVSVVEPEAGRVRFQQRYSEHDIVGLTWTKEADLGIVAARPEGFDVMALRPKRDVQHENLTPTQTQ
jgi:hypothetical protein